MTELSGYRPDQTPQSVAGERFVFVDPNDRHAREFDIATAAMNQGRTIGADSPEVSKAVEDAYAAVQQERNDAAARTVEHNAQDAELAQAIDWNAQAINATREYVETNGF